MAEIKWIKIATNVFDSKKIKQIETLPDGDTIIVIWFKLLVLAGNINDNGFIYFTKDIPYTDQMLANYFNRPLTTMQLALKIFQQFEMIEIVDDILFVSNWEEYQNVEGMEKIREQNRIRVARYRERKSLEMKSQKCSYCGDIASGYDHIIAKARGGSDEDSNKVPCCKYCNQIKNDKPLVDFLNNNRERINDKLIMDNPKLRKYVTLHNVTNRYIVTQCHATDIDKDIDKDNKNIYNAHFQEFWEVYPRKVGKKKAYKCYQARLKEGYSEEEMITAARNYVAECEKTKRDAQYIKYPTTFLSVDTPFADYLPTKEEKSKDSIDVKKLFGLEFQQTPPYFGFPEQWFDGEELVKERVVPLVCPRDQEHGVSDDIPYSVQDLIDTFNARRRYFNGERTEIL